MVVGVAGLSMSAALDQNAGVDTTTAEYRTQTGIVFGATLAGGGAATWYGKAKGQPWLQGFHARPRTAVIGGHGRADWDASAKAFMFNGVMTGPSCGGAFFLGNNARYCG